MKISTDKYKLFLKKKNSPVFLAIPYKTIDTLQPNLRVTKQVELFQCKLISFDEAAMLYTHVSCICVYLFNR